MSQMMMQEPQAQGQPPMDEQQTHESVAQQQEDDFDAGFDIGNAEDSAGDSAPDSAPSGPDSGAAAANDAVTQPAAAAPVDAAAQQSLVQQQQPPMSHLEAQQQALQQQIMQQQMAQQQMQAAQQQAANTPATVAIGEEIREEWERLKEINPAAAALAEENSVEGAQVRARLAEFGASIAYDKAEYVLNLRNAAVRSEQAARVERQRQIEAQNNHFFTVLEREHPQHVALLRDPNRQAEAQRKIQDIFAWINGLPYAEAAPLMRVAQSGTDPVEVSRLLTRYERERGGQRQGRKPPDDYAGALAVPSRGAPGVPAGIGDSDSFDAGWNINEAER